MKGRVMVVDDNKDILYTLRLILEKNGYEVITLDNGKDCLKTLEKGFKGVILMDLMMPGLDGWHTINEIVKRDLDEDVVIEIMTGNGTSDFEKMQDIAAYIYDYLTKPLEEKEIVGSVEKGYDLIN
ncbi:MAG: response regulator [Candidatus Thermoplasmatota archaeon]